ncbi:class II aldolase/adducin family protein [Actinomadura chibensis]|nr:class II aldolase/adducin family protein [Actinomadura chibensis]
MAEAEEAVAAVGDAQLALLANHGVLVLADNIRQAHLRAVTLEWEAMVRKELRLDPALRASIG